MRLPPPKVDDYEYQERVAIILEHIEKPTQEQEAKAKLQAIKEIQTRKQYASMRQM